MGLTDFSTIDGKCVISYQWNFATVSGTYGVQILTSAPIDSSYDCALSRIKSTIFYMKTWKCQTTSPYFNLTSNLCQNGCAEYYFANTSVLACQDCPWGCYKCSNGTTCTGCDSLIDRRVLKNVGGQASCLCMPGYFQDPSNHTNKVCLACISNCLNCTNSTSCVVCNEIAGYMLTADKKCKMCGYACLACNDSPFRCL